MTPSPVFSNMLVHLADGVATLTFNNEASGNPLSLLQLKDYLAAMTWASESLDVKVIIQTGSGKFYSTGKDLLAEPEENDLAAANDEYIYHFRKLNEVLIECKKVTIAAVNGPAIGYGTTSLALYDLVYAVPEAYFITPFMKWGFCAEGCSSFTFERIMGRQRAAAMLLAGDRMSAEELKAAGMINKIFPRGSFQEEVVKVAQRIAGYPQGAVEFTKGLMMKATQEELKETNARECIGLRERFLSRESLDLVAAFATQQRARKAKSNL